MNIVDVLSILPFFIELFMNEEEIKVFLTIIFVNIHFELFLGNDHHSLTHLV